MLVVHNCLEIITEPSDKYPRRKYCTGIGGSIKVQFEKRDECIPLDVAAAQELLDEDPGSIDPDLGPLIHVKKWKVSQMLGWGYFEVEVEDEGYDSTNWDDEPDYRDYDDGE